MAMGLTRRVWVSLAIVAFAMAQSVAGATGPNGQRVNPPPNAEQLDYPKAVSAEDGDNLGDPGPGAEDDSQAASWRLDIKD